MPTRTVTATVTERTIKLDRQHVTQNNVSIDRLVLALDAEWEGCDDVKVMFYQDGGSVLVDYREGGIDFPAEVVTNLETLRLTVLGYFANGDRIVTKKMDAADSITVDESGMLEAQGAVEATKDAYQRLFEAAGNIDASEASAKTSMEAAREAAVSAQASANALAGVPWSGNVPKATVAGSLVHVEDAYPSPIVEARVEGRSSQAVTTGANLAASCRQGTSASGYSVSLFVDAVIEKGKTYTLSFIGAQGNALYLNERITTKYTTLTATGQRQSVSFTVKDNTDFSSDTVIYEGMLVLLKNDAANTVMPSFTDVMLQEGSKATGYEPYSGGFASPSPDWPQPVEGISAPELVVTGADTSVATRHAVDLKGEELRSLPDGTCDELVVDTAGNYGILKRVGSITLDGSASEAWQTALDDANAGLYLIGVADVRKGTSAVTNLYCNRFKATTGYWNAKNSTLVKYGQFHFYPDTSVIPSGKSDAGLAEWRAWLGTNNVQVCYPLNEETYVPLGTLDEAVRLPEKTSNVWVEAGKETVVSVTYVRDINDILAALEALLNN